MNLPPSPLTVWPVMKPALEESIKTTVPRGLPVASQGAGVALRFRQRRGERLARLFGNGEAEVITLAVML
ncbi:hypothetical protein ACGFNP_04525 [Nonomuraea sp. NPDC049269]|uniref:hypothetical protein n=1 Tax=Nonomuraea sp. NPDC049269 TaxID=3364349 RepID=UPI00371ECF86